MAPRGEVAEEDTANVQPDGVVMLELALSPKTAISRLPAVGAVVNVAVTLV
jgi:hypothetical protein